MGASPTPNSSPLSPPCFQPHRIHSPARLLPLCSLTQSRKALCVLFPPLTPAHARTRPHTRHRSWLSSLRSATSRVPLLGAGADYLYGLVDTSTAYYCYTSGSNESGGCNKDARVPLLLLFDIRRTGIDNAPANLQADGGPQGWDRGPTSGARACGHARRNDRACSPVLGIAAHSTVGY